MMKYYVVLILAMLGLGACTSPEKEKEAAEPQQTENTIPDSLLIKPGESIGNIKLGNDMQALAKISGNPDQSDAGMGGASYTWFAKHDAAGYRTSVYGHRSVGAANENLLYIKKILVTSPGYIAPGLVHTGLSRTDVAKAYQLTDSSRYAVKGKTVDVFSDLSKGISFEIDSVSKKITAISVFMPGDTAAARINMY